MIPTVPASIDLAMLQPAVALVIWTLFMLGWLLVTRLPALRAAGIRLDQLVGTKAADADRTLPAKAQWKAHNYMHLLEQPVLFYVVVVVLALVGVNDFATRLIAWGYVTMRIVHSVWQARVNQVSVRFYLFAASTALLVALTGRAAFELFGEWF